jgi:AraC-like DNA-binding protein
MRRLGQQRIQECVDRRAGLLGHVAGTGTSASIRCPVGTYCLAVPVYAQGFHVVTIRAGGFTRKMGASKARADAIRELLLLVSDELGRRAAAMIAHPLSGNAAVRRAMDHIHAHSNEPVRIQDIAAEVGVSRQHLVKIWKQHVGLTLHSCLRAVRIDHAKALLETDGHKIIEVAMACGFGSLSQFNRAFLRVTGVSPSCWISQVR